MADTLIPHYLLFDASREDSAAGQCRFVLRRPDGSCRLEAETSEPGVLGDRLALLSVVRGLEALDRPARVMLVTPCSYVREGIRRGLSEWRTNGWRWECFGQMVPVKNLDLWQRVDRAMQYHRVDCRMYRIDPPHPVHSNTEGVACTNEGHAGGVHPATRRLQYRLGRFAMRLGCWIAATVGGWIRRLGRPGSEEGSRRSGCERPSHWTRLDN